MSGELAKGFLDHFVANIDDDTPRLVYADYLDEQGLAERAEFIRVQVERHRRPTWDPAQVRLRVREKQLLDTHGEEWLAEMPKVPGAKWEGFRRGIVAEVSFASYDSLRKNAHTCRAVAPVEAVTVRWPRRREPRENPPPIAELRELRVTGRPDGEAEVGRLADSPQLTTVRTLTASVWAETFARLMQSPHLTALTALRLPNNGLYNDGIEALVAAPALHRLEELDLTGRGVNDGYNRRDSAAAPGMSALADWSGLATLRALNLTHNILSAPGLRALLRSPNAGGLKSLTLRATGLGAEAMAEFASANKKLRLDALDVGDNLLTDAGAGHLGSAACLRELKCLRTDRAHLTQKGATAFLRGAKLLGELRQLDLSFNQLRRAGLEALLDRAPPHLHTLGLRDCDLLDAGLELLAGSPPSDTLHDLDVSRNGLTVAAVLALCEAKHLSNLAVLRMTDNRVTESHAAALSASPLGRRLAALEWDLHHPTPTVTDQFALPSEDDIPF